MPFELSRVNLGKVCREVLDMLEPILREREANTEVVGEAPDVLGNPDRLKQVVSNLVENASRFIDPGGHIVIELFGLRGNSIVAVKDDGCGFGDADPALLFDRFYRTDSSRSRGTGRHGPGACHREVGGGGARRHRGGHQPARWRRLLHRGRLPAIPGDAA